MMKNVIKIQLVILIIVMIFGCEKKELENTNVTIGEVNSLDFHRDFFDTITFPSEEQWNSFSLDINGDNDKDIEFTYDADVGNFYGYHGTYIAHLDSNFSFLLDSSSIKVCSKGEIINCDDNFDDLGGDYETFLLSYFYYSSVPYQVNDSTWELIDTSYYRGVWHEYEDKYISYKFADDNGCFIGWIRLGFNTEGKLEIYEYGFKEINGCS